MKTKLELVSMANKIGDKANKKPYVQRLFYDTNTKKVEGEFMKPDRFLKINEEEREYEWNLEDDQPYRIGSCVDYSTYSQSLGSYQNGVWKEMTFGDVRKFLELDDHNSVAVVKESKARYTVGPNDIDIRDL